MKKSVIFMMCMLMAVAYTFAQESTPEADAPYFGLQLVEGNGFTILIPANATVSAEGDIVEATALQIVGPEVRYQFDPASADSVSMLPAYELSINVYENPD